MEDVTVTVEGTPSYEPPPSGTRDAWSVVLQELLARRAQAEAVETPVERAPPEAEYIPAPVFLEPAGTLGASIQAHARLELDLSRWWVRFPRDKCTTSWEDFFASKRRNVMIVYQATVGYTQAEHASRSKWQCSKIGRIQIPVEFASDRSFLPENRDALYLERMHD